MRPWETMAVQPLAVTWEADVSLVVFQPRSLPLVIGHFRWSHLASLSVRIIHPHPPLPKRGNHQLRVKEEKRGNVGDVIGGAKNLPRKSRTDWSSSCMFDIFNTMADSSPLETINSPQPLLSWPLQVSC